MAVNEEMNTPIEGEPNKSPAPAKKKDTQSKPNIFVRFGRRIKKFWNDYMSELKKVVWMPRKDVSSSYSARYCEYSLLFSSSL